MNSVATLIATKNRMGLLARRSLPSVVQQTHLPRVVVVVNDGPALAASDLSRLRSIGATAGVEVVLLRNRRTPGAGGAWNTGLEWLSGQGAGGFVAILDDDDTWDPEHIGANLSASHDANITVSGLRMRLGRQVIERPLIEHLEPQTFLVGNPGWQGSNTFVTLDLLLRVGGFREGLQSLNDRDLVFRLLSHPAAEWRLVPRWTASWHADTPGNLSAPRSKQKLEGLRAFWALYSHKMGSAEQRHFFDRAQRLFGVEHVAILASPVPTCPRLGFAAASNDA